MSTNDINNNNNEQEQATPSELYDRYNEAKRFESTKLGVKGLVDSGITHIPRIFHHPPETLFNSSSSDNDSNQLIPVIDMSSEGHIELVGRIRDAASELGFFQVINHGVPNSLLRCLVDAVRAIHETTAEEKVGYYKRDIVDVVGTGFGFYSNHDLFHSKAASWRDTISVRLGPTPVNPQDIPAVCRDEVMEWEKEVKRLGERLIGLLSEGLGLHTDRLKGVSYLGRVNMVGHYYPYCPEPDKTVGLSSHTDLGMLTILLQDQSGGLQVKHGETWINLKPVDGALVINIGDLFQVLSNDKYKSGEHRVYANPWKKPRVSIGTFFGPANNEDKYGPLEELITPENPKLYEELNFSDLFNKFLTRESNSKSMANHFRL